jgi:TFIIF-interacting CTD phosphatase-like protein
MNDEQQVRIEIRVEGWLNKMCEGSVAQAIAFLKALEKEQKDEQDK